MGQDLGKLIRTPGREKKLSTKKMKEREFLRQGGPYQFRGKGRGYSESKLKRRGGKGSSVTGQEAFSREVSKGSSVYYLSEKREKLRMKGYASGKGGWEPVYRARKEMNFYVKSQQGKRGRVDECNIQRLPQGSGDALIGKKDYVWGGEDKERGQARGLLKNPKFRQGGGRGTKGKGI